MNRSGGLATPIFSEWRLELLTILMMKMMVMMAMMRLSLVLRSPRHLVNFTVPAHLLPLAYTPPRPLPRQVSWVSRLFNEEH